MAPRPPKRPAPRPAGQTNVTIASRARRSAPAATKKPPVVAPPVPTYAPGTPDPTQIPSMAHQQALADVNAALGAIPSVDTISSPYQTQGLRVDALTKQLSDQLRGEQTYRVNLATGLPEAAQASGAALQGQANQTAAALGGTAAALPTTAAAGTLASFGTSAANQVAQQQVTAPLAGAAYHSQIDQALLNALGQRTQAVSAENAKLPALENQYRTALNQSAFQGYVADRNYKLAAGNAGFDQAYKKASLQASTQGKAASIAATDARAAASRQNQWKITQARIRASETNANATRTAADAKAATAAAAKKATSLGATQKYVDQQLQKRYKGKAGTGGGVSGYTVSYKSVDPNDPANIGGGAKTVTPEQWKAYQAGGSKDPTLLGLKPTAVVGQAIPKNKTGSTGTATGNPDRATDWAKGYLSRQNSVYGWGLSAADITRLAQQSVRDSGIWPKRPRTAAPTAKPSATPKVNSYNDGRKTRG